MIRGGKEVWVPGGVGWGGWDSILTPISGGSQETPQAHSRRMPTRQDETTIQPLFSFCTQPTTLNTPPSPLGTRTGGLLQGCSEGSITSTWSMFCTSFSMVSWRAQGVGWLGCDVVPPWAVQGRSEKSSGNSSITRSVCQYEQ